MGSDAPWREIRKTPSGIRKGDVVRNIVTGWTSGVMLVFEYGTTDVVHIMLEEPPPGAGNWWAPEVFEVVQTRGRFSDI